MLRVDSERRGRSKSPGRQRERSRSNVRAPSPGPQYQAANVLQYQDDQTANMQGAKYAQPQASQYAQPQQFQHQEVSANYAAPSSYLARTTSNDGRYQYANPVPASQGGDARDLSLNSSGSVNFHIGHGQQPQYASPSAQYAQPTSAQYAQPQASQYAPQQGANYAQPHHNSVSGPSTNPAHYAPEGSYQYATPDQRITYKYKSDQPQGQFIDQSGHHRHHSNSLSALSPGGLPQQMGGLTIGGMPGQMPGGYGAPPGSPLLESYHGTYQQLSPMPSPMMLPSHGSQSLEDLSPLSSDSDDSDSSDDSDDIAERHSHSHPGDKRGRLWSVNKDCKKLAAALKEKDQVDVEPLITILPKLKHKQILELREKYRDYAKYKGKGINITKQIKTYLPSGAFNKACYATTLGQWESEAYWANFWYQGGGTKHELLIESLMGRTNAEIAAIKAGFSDKRYNDSLEKCMKAELKANKFRTCVLLALEEKRQEETALLHAHEVAGDVETLRKAVSAKEGGETAMINIIVRRSDVHLREVLRLYEQKYRKGFTREMLAKSQNLVGEVLTHILNGALNRPMRDAMLLNQCLDTKHALSSAKEKEAAKLDLLVSRLVRLHWDRRHLEYVKMEYRRRYGKELAVAVQGATKGEVSEYLIQLCVRRE